MDAPRHIFLIMKFIDVSNLTFKGQIVKYLFLYGTTENENNFFFYCNIDPACQSISPEMQCYVRERNCTAQSNTEESSSQNNVMLIMSIGSVIVFIASCILILCYMYKRRRANINKSEFNTMHDLFYLLAI